MKRSSTTAKAGRAHDSPLGASFPALLEVAFQVGPADCRCSRGRRLYPLQRSLN
ncbi:MAG: hypothetical protein ABI353_07885 [Isosphaeraceae bacterium]